ncbi:MAG: hypothetical protein HC886_20275 [Leptolyngbyaceae cyanobacterium SM1_1_3]|nr:hypothetical protein [Leptolyngbyaceae cyanobacterium SM1_1_3]
MVDGGVGDRVGADQQQDDVGGVELLLLDSLSAIATGKNLALAPNGDDFWRSERGKVVDELGL